MNPLSQVYINRKSQKYVSISICHYHRASFMKSLFIAYLEQWVISWPSGLISVFCECVVCFYFCLFSYFCCGVYYLLRYWGKFCKYLWQSSIVVHKFLSWVSTSGLLQPSAINITGLVQIWKKFSYILSPLASKNYLLQSTSVELIVSIFMFQ